MKVLGQQTQGFRAVACSRGQVALIFQHHLNHVKDAGLIVNYQNVLCFGYRELSSGNFQVVRSTYGSESILVLQPQLAKRAKSVIIAASANQERNHDRRTNQTVAAAVG